MPFAQLVALTSLQSRAERADELWSSTSGCLTFHKVEIPRVKYEESLRDQLNAD